MSQFWSPLVHKLTPYVPGEQPKVDNLVKLNTNENPYPPSEKVYQAIHDAANQGLRLYPDPNADALKQALQQYYGLADGQVFIGNGSDEVLAHIFMGLLKHDKPLLFPDITYSFYPVYAELYEIDYRTLPLTDSFDIDPADYDIENGGIIFPNPNAPTGKLMPLETIKSLLGANPNSVLVVDEAYIDFGGDSAVSLIEDYPNLLVVQTYSKSRSLAGMRIGYAMGQSHLIEGLERVKNSFNSYPIDRLALAAGVAAIEDQDYFDECSQKIIQTREELVAFLTDNGFDVVPSAANFVFTKHKVLDAEWIAQKLREQAIIVRYFNKPRIDQYLRISIGTDAENDALCNALASILKQQD